jgi:hypothetical protein
LWNVSSVFCGFIRNFCPISFFFRTVNVLLSHSVMELSPSWEAANCAAIHELPSILWNRSFITVFTRTLHWSLSLARSIQSIPSYPSKIHFNIVHPPTSWPSQWSPSYRLSHQYPIGIPPLPHSYYMPCPPHPPWLDRSNYTWRRVQVMKLLICPSAYILYRIIFLYPLVLRRFI